MSRLVIVMFVRVKQRETKIGNISNFFPKMKIKMDENAVIFSSGNFMVYNDENILVFLRGFFPQSM